MHPSSLSISMVYSLYLKSDKPNARRINHAETMEEDIEVNYWKWDIRMGTKVEGQQANRHVGLGWKVSIIG